jgi:hypothetical protein
MDPLITGPRGHTRLPMVSTIFSETVVPGSFVLLWEIRGTAWRHDRYALLRTVTGNGSLRRLTGLRRSLGMHMSSSDVP